MAGSLSVASMIPFAGWASTGVKFARTADRIVDAAKIADDVYDAARAASRAEAVADATKIIDEAFQVKKPYIKSGSRPKHSKEFIEMVWEAAKNAEGRVLGRDGKELFWDRTKPRNGQWDMGHVEGHEYVTLHEKYRNGSMSYEDFMKEYKPLGNYEPQSVHYNRIRNQIRRRK